MSKRIFEAIIRNDFKSFIHKSFNTINPNIKFQKNWHIDLISDYLERVNKGEIKRLIINMPPRSLKSVCVSVAWPAWILGANPAARLMVASYSQVLSIKHSLDTKLIIDSDWYKQIFPSMQISKKHNLKSKFLTTEQGFRFATSVGGSATGEGGDFLIIDDPHNPSHINSKKMRARVIDWYEQTFITRLNDKKKGAIVIVMQRLHEEDLVGHLLEKNPSIWEHIKLPAIAQENTNYFIYGKLKEIKEGDILHSGREDIEYVKQMQIELGNLNFAAQYQQEPVNANSSMLNMDNIEYYERLPKDFEFKILSLDAASKTKDINDYSVATIWGIKENNYYLIDMIRKKLEYPDLKRIIISNSSLYKLDKILIEDIGSGQALIQDLKRSTSLPVISVKAKLDKVTRFASVLEFFEAKRVHIPKNALWQNIFIKEIMAFPSSKNDDIVDSISQFLNYVKYNNLSLNYRIRAL